MVIITKEIFLLTFKSKRVIKVEIHRGQSRHSCWSQPPPPPPRPLAPALLLLLHRQVLLLHLGHLNPWGWSPFPHLGHPHHHLGGQLPLPLQNKVTGWSFSPSAPTLHFVLDHNLILLFLLTLHFLLFTNEISQGRPDLRGWHHVGWSVRARMEFTQIHSLSIPHFDWKWKW